MTQGRKPGFGAVIPLADDAERDARVIERHREQAKELATALKPNGLPADVARVWDTMAPWACHPTKKRVADEGNAFAFAMLCYEVARFHRLSKRLMREGDTYESATRNGVQYKNRPEVGQLNVAWTNAFRGMLEFGMTPASAKRMLEDAPGQGDLFGDRDDHADFG